MGDNLTRAWRSQDGPVKLALIGAGRMGSAHLRALGDEIVAVVEPADVDVPHPRRYRTVGELLRDGDPDGAVVAVPSRFHVPVVRELLAAGVPVLCEKPCGLTSEDARLLGAESSAAGVALHVGYWRRFVPALRELREKIAAGELGELELIHCAQWDERPPPAAFRDPASSGGILVDMGVHELDQLRWLTGQDIAAVSTVSSSVTFDPPVEGDPESVALALELTGGTIALVSLLRRHPPGDLCRVEVVATEGTARIDFLSPEDGEVPFLAALREQARDFAAAIRGEPSHGATAEDASAALAAAERITRSQAPR
jgi:myo-inositol 2-dehydrogenase/D-chiro-inositol 1-dehydrogenase